MAITIPPALHHRRFRLLWLGMVLAWAANQMQLWTLFWQIRTITDLPLALGIVGLIRVLPILGVSLVSGAVADTLNRRRLLFATQGVFAVVALALGLLALTQRADLGALYGLIALQSFATAFDLPARESLIPGLVPVQNLQNAFSLRVSGIQIGALVGPAVAGLLIARLGLHSPYFAALSLYLVVSFLIFLIGPVPNAISPDRPPAISLTAIVEGIRFTTRNPLILPSMLLDFFATLFTRADSLMPIFARDILGVGPVAYGWLSAAQAIGATTAGILISGTRALRSQGRALFISVAGIGLGAILFGSSRIFSLSMVALILIGASDAVSSIIRNTLRQLETPDHLRGRMVSINQIFFMGGPQLGELRAGAFGQIWGVPMALISGGIACLATTAYIAGRWPVLRRYSG